MAHVQAPTGIGKHRQTIVFLAFGRLIGTEGLIVVPVGLNLGFQFPGIIEILHKFVVLSQQP